MEALVLLHELRNFGRRLPRWIEGCASDRNQPNDRLGRILDVTTIPAQLDVGLERRLLPEGTRTRKEQKSGENEAADFATALQNRIPMARFI